MFPGPGVVGDAVPAPAAPAKLSRRLLPGPAPLHAVRVPQGDAPSLRSVTLPAWPLPAFRSAAWSVVPPLRPVTGPPLPLSHVQASSPVAPGLSCRLLRKATGPPSPPLPDSAPGWTPGLARSALGRAAHARHAGRVPALPPPAGGAVGGRPGWTPGRSAAVLRWSPASLAPNILPPPLLPPSAVWPSSRPASGVTLFAGLSFSRSSSSRLRPSSPLSGCRRASPRHVAAVGRRLPAAPAATCPAKLSAKQEAASGPPILRIPIRARARRGEERLRRPTAPPLFPPSRSGLRPSPSDPAKPSPRSPLRGQRGCPACPHLPTLGNHAAHGFQSLEDSRGCLPNLGRPLTRTVQASEGH